MAAAARLEDYKFKTRRQGPPGPAGASGRWGGAQALRPCPKFRPPAFCGGTDWGSSVGSSQDGDPEKDEHVRLAAAAAVADQLEKDEEELGGSRPASPAVMGMEEPGGSRPVSPEVMDTEEPGEARPVPPDAEEMSAAVGLPRRELPPLDAEVLAAAAVAVKADEAEREPHAPRRVRKPPTAAISKMIDEWPGLPALPDQDKMAAAEEGGSLGSRLASRVAGAGLPMGWPNPEVAAQWAPRYEEGEA